MESPKVRNGVCGNLQKALGRAHASASIHRVHRDRETVIANLRATVDQLRDVIAQMVMAHDELEWGRRFAEQQMWRYQTLFDTAPDAYVVTDAMGVIVDVNGAAQQLLSRDAGRLVDAPLGRILRTCDGDSLVHALHPVVRAGSREAWTLRCAPGCGPDFAVTASVRTGKAMSGEVELRWIIRADRQDDDRRTRSASSGVAG